MKTSSQIIPQSTRFANEGTLAFVELVTDQNQGLGRLDISAKRARVYVLETSTIGLLIQRSADVRSRLRGALARRFELTQLISFEMIPFRIVRDYATTFARIEAFDPAL